MYFVVLHIQQRQTSSTVWSNVTQDLISVGSSSALFTGQWVQVTFKVECFLMLVDALGDDGNQSAHLKFKYNNLDHRICLYWFSCMPYALQIIGSSWIYKNVNELHWHYLNFVCPAEEKCGAALHLTGSSSTYTTRITPVSTWLQPRSHVDVCL